MFIVCIISLGFNNSFGLGYKQTAMIEILYNITFPKAQIESTLLNK